MNTINGLGGSTPQFNQPVRAARVQALYHSYPEQALILDATILGGFGVLAQGTVMADMGNYIVPYTPTIIAATDVSRAFLTANVSAAKDLFVTNASAAKFKVGQSVVASDTDNTYTDGGAITAIVVDATPGITKITVTNNITATVAKSGNIYHKAGSDGKFSLATCIIDQAVDTGSAASVVASLGANVSIVLSNAVLYTSAVVGLDAAAKTALGVVTRGKYTILK